MFLYHPELDHPDPFLSPPEVPFSVFDKSLKEHSEEQDFFEDDDLVSKETPHMRQCFVMCGFFPKPAIFFERDFFFSSVQTLEFAFHKHFFQLH